MRILIDMNLTPRWCKLLETRQHEAFHWSSIGPLTASDREFYEYACYAGIEILTTDLDIVKTVRSAGNSRTRIFILRGEPLTPEVHGLAVLNAIRDCRAGLPDNDSVLKPAAWLIDLPNGSITPIGQPNHL
jgi:predicted nuclease of predicted toxin-antitoxin system